MSVAANQTFSWPSGGKVICNICVLPNAKLEKQAFEYWSRWLGNELFTLSMYFFLFFILSKGKFKANQCIL